MKKVFFLAAILIAMATVAPLAYSASAWDAQDYNLYAGDFNGDGKSDILYIAKNPAQPSGIAVSNGTGPNIVWQEWPSSFLGINWSANTYTVIVADFNGDGRADILLQANTSGATSYLLLTDPTGHISSITESISPTLFGANFVFTSDQHKLVAGDFNGDGKADLFLQATSSAGTDAILLAGTNGQFSGTPAQSWSDGFNGLNWATTEANVYAGHFAAGTMADLLVQAKPKFVEINFDVPFPVPTYPANMNAVLLAQSGGVFSTSGVGLTKWSRFANGADWSSLTANVVVGDFNGDGISDVLLQGKYSSTPSYVVLGTGTSAAFSATPETVSTNVAITSDSAQLVVGNFAGTASGAAGLYVQALASAGTDYVADSITTSGSTATIAASTDAPPTLPATSVGRTSGAFGVSQNGGANYSIPLFSPPGPHGMQPKLSLNYDSQGASTYVGVGWNLGGLSAITRCSLTYAQDISPAPVTLTASDGLCLDGQRLRLTGGTYGAAGSTYQTELANFITVTAYGSAGNGPAYFVARDANASTFTYGNGGSSQVIATGSTTALSWQLNEVRDAAGNTMTVAYNTATGSAVPKTVSWTPSSAGSTTYNYTMSFSYGTNSPQGSTYGFKAGTLVNNTNLLNSITVAYLGTTVKKYLLNHQASPTTGRYDLISIQECADSATTNCFAPTTFAYQPGASGVSTSNNSTVSLPVSAHYLVDVNGDGHPDLLYGVYAAPTITGYPGTYHWYVALGNGSTFSSSPIDTNVTTFTTDNMMIADMTGSGRVGFLYPTNAWGASAPSVWNWAHMPIGAATFTLTSTGVSAGTNGALDYNVIAADANGDGLPDLIYCTDGLHVMFLRNTTAPGGLLSFAPITSATTLWTAGTGQTIQIQNISKYQNNGPVGVLDFNGDGRADFIVSVTSAPSDIGVSDVWFYALISNGGTALAPAYTANKFYYQGDIIPSKNASYLAPLPMVVDWNHDGCADIVTWVLAAQGGGYDATIALSPCLSNLPDISTWTTITTDVVGGPLGGRVLAIDWNGDGLPGLLWYPGNSAPWNLAQSTGSGVLPSVATSIPYTSGVSDVFDMDGDGQDDIMVNYATDIGIVLHNDAGHPPDLLSAVIDGYGNSVSPNYVSIVQSNYELSDPTTFADAVYPYQNYIGPLYVVSQATFSDPSNPPDGTYNQQYYYYGAWTNLQGRGLQGFYSKRTADSRYASMSPVLTRYEYYERAFPFTGMKFQDLLTTGVFYPTQSVGTPATTPQTLLSGTAYQQRYFPYFTNWTTNQREVGGTENGASENGDLITTTSTNYTYDTYGNATTVVTIVTDSDPNSPYTGDTWTTSTTNTTDISVNQSADLAASCLSVLDGTQTVYSSSINGTNTVTRTKTFTPDTPAKCRILTAVTEPTANSGLYKVTETVTYDSFGNIATDTATGNNMPSSPASREIQQNWGTTGQFLNWATDASGAKSTWTYTSNQAFTFGVPDSMKDANNLTSSWGYDAFGRKTSATHADGTSTAWIWSTCTSYCGWSSSVYQVAQTAYQTNGTAIRTGTTSYDPLDRITQIAGPTVTGATATVQTVYNSLGLPAHKSMAFLNGAPVYQQTYGYDALNRVTSVTRPISSTNSNPQSTTYGYAGRTQTVSDPYNNKKTAVIDVNGWMRQTQDAQSPTGYKVTRSLDAAGSLIGITDSIGNTLLKNVTYRYGIRPFLVAATDADRGAWTYTVDSLGERTGWTDAKGQSFSMTYDALSRPLTRTEPDLFTQWTWGSTPATYNVGQLIAACTGTEGACAASTGYSETRAFDSYGRLSTRAITEGGNPGNDTGGVFLFTLAYNATTGLPNSLTYPKSTSGFALTLQYGYGNGLLQSVTDTSDTTTTCGTTCTLWTANAMNAFGQITQETLGNGVMINRTYDAVTAWLTQATAGVGGGAALLNQSYLQDDNGNLTQRQAVVQGQGLTENFFYDNDYRLTCATLSSSCSSPTVVYDGSAAGPGNITSQAGVGVYSYPASGQPLPHAVTSITGTFNGITNPTFSYDANGNMTSRAGSAVTWFSNNYPAEISASDATGNEGVQFKYGPDRQRWEQIYTAPGGTEQTYYIGGLIDLVFNGTTDYRQYIYAGSEPIAVYSRTSAGVNTIRYMVEDHQGSVSSITSNTGAVDINESYSAFGARRNPTTWSGAPVAPDLVTIAGISRQGYTFQTWLGQSMGLNHMNGRVQDAILGRFLSPDPYIPDTNNAQSYNRYSYVNNSPLNYTDPSGFDPEDGTDDDTLTYFSPFNADSQDGWSQTVPGMSNPSLYISAPSGAESLGLPSDAFDFDYFTGSGGDSSDDLSEITTGGTIMSPPGSVGPVATPDSGPGPSQASDGSSGKSWIDLSSQLSGGVGVAASYVAALSTGRSVAVVNGNLRFYANFFGNKSVAAYSVAKSAARLGPPLLLFSAVLDIANENKSWWDVGRNAGVGYGLLKLGVRAPGPAAVITSAYFAIDEFYPGGVGAYVWDTAEYKRTVGDCVCYVPLN
jgi:RHS repeat-associated protein